VVFFASNKRSAIRLRKRVIGTRFSERELYATVLMVFCSVAKGSGVGGRITREDIAREVAKRDAQKAKQDVATENTASHTRALNFLCI